MIIIDDNTCGTCIHGTMDDSNKAKITVFCNVADKTRIYGSCVACDNYKKEVLNEQSSEI